MFCDLAYLVQVEVAVDAQRHQVRQALGGEVLFGDAQLLVTEGAFVDSWTGGRSHIRLYRLGLFMDRRKRDVDLPRMPMSTAGSLEGICCRKGRISSRTNHLSRYSKILPRHTREFTLTCSEKEVRHVKTDQK